MTLIRDFAYYYANCLAWDKVRERVVVVIEPNINPDSRKYDDLKFVSALLQGDMPCTCDTGKGTVVIPICDLEFNKTLFTGYVNTDRGVVFIGQSSARSANKGASGNTTEVTDEEGKTIKGVSFRYNPRIIDGLTERILRGFKKYTSYQINAKKRGAAFSREIAAVYNPTGLPKLLYNQVEIGLYSKKKKRFSIPRALLGTEAHKALLTIASENEIDAFFV